jgi:hypothetical protein
MLNWTHARQPAGGTRQRCVPGRSTGAARGAAQQRAPRVLTPRGRARLPPPRPPANRPAPAAALPAAAAPPPYGDAVLLARQAAALFAASAVLGPMCDGLHSSADVLHYTNPSVLLRLPLSWGGAWGLETCWWVPLLFGTAGVIIGVGTPLLDELAAAGQQRQQQPSGPGAAAAEANSSSGSGGGDKIDAAAPPGWPAVLLCISLFVGQYWLSGWLEHALLRDGGGGELAGAAAAAAGAANASTWPVEDAVLAAAAASLWAGFDRTPQGAFMAALTAACGPAVEVGLINLLGLYSYTHPQWLGVPLWIPWVYAAGAVARVGGPARGRRVGPHTARPCPDLPALPAAPVAHSRRPRGRRPRPPGLGHAQGAAAARRVVTPPLQAPAVKSPVPAAPRP